MRSAMLFIDLTTCVVHYGEGIKLLFAVRNATWFILLTGFDVNNDKE